MKKLLLLFTTILSSVNIAQAQCDLDTSYTNTGSNMTVFFTPTAASSIYAELGDGVLGAFYIDAEGDYSCAGSFSFSGVPYALPVNADDATTNDKDGFASGEAINWFYLSSDGRVSSLVLTPNDNFTINGVSYISSASITIIDCGGSDDISSGEACPPLDFNFVNTGSNMTLFITPTGAATLGPLGDGTIGVYYQDNTGNLVCGGASFYTGNQLQITAYADDATTTDIKDGFADTEAIIWKFEDENNNQFDLTPNPQDVFSLNAISFITEISYDVISCEVDTVEGCTDSAYLEYNANANTDDGSCLTAVVYGCIDVGYTEYSASANTDDGSCVTLIVNGCTDAAYTEYSAAANTDDGSCVTLIVNGCIDSAYIEYNANANVDNGSCSSLIVEGCTNDEYVEYTASANTDDGSCVTPVVNGCTDAAYTEYSAAANTDDGSCFTINLEGCMDSTACNFNSNATTDDSTCYNNDEGCGCDQPAAASGYDCSGVCLLDSDGDGVCDAFEILGCQDPLADNFDSTATDLGVCNYLGCTDIAYLEYTASANTDDSSCTTLIVTGCTDSNASNFNVNANVSNDSCEYDLIGDGCSVSFTYINTGVNASIFINENAGGLLNVGDSIGVFYMAADGTAQCAGASAWLGGTTQIVAFGDDGTTDEKDGLATGDPYLMLAKSGDNVYLIEPSYVSASMGSYVLNDISMIIDLDFQLACTVEYLGCTDELYIEYDSNANLDDGSCTTLIVTGCTDSNASNFNVNANVSNDSCEYDLIGDGCSVSFTYINTGVNASIFINENAGGLLNVGDSIGVFYMAADGTAQCAGASAWLGGTTQIVAFGDDGTTDEKDGLATGDPYLMLAKSGDNVYLIEPSYVSASMGSYVLNDISMIIDLDFQLACTVEYPGCTDINACNYDSTANTNDGTCYNNDLGCGCDQPAAETGYDCAGVCLLDSDDDDVCDAFEISGCQEPLADNFDSTATDSDVCIYLGCIDSTACNFDATANTSDSSCYNNDLGCGCDQPAAATGYDCFGVCILDSDGDGVCDAFEILGCLDTAAFNYDQYATESDTCVSWEQAYETCVESGGDDGIGQVDVDAAYDYGVASVDITSNDSAVYSNAYAEGAASITPEDGVSQSDVDAAAVAAYAAGAASVTPDDGISQADLDAAAIASYAAGAASVTPEDGVSQADLDAAAASNYNTGFTAGAASVTPEDGVSQADLDAAVASANTYSNAIIDSLQSQIDALQDNSNGDSFTQADIDAAYANGAASVDITSDNSAVSNQAYTFGYSDGYNLGLVDGDDGIGQTEVDAAYANGAASVVPEDGIGQAEVDAAYANGVASVTPDDGIGQTEVDAAYANGVASVIPDDGIGQAEVDAAYTNGVASVDITSDNSAVADAAYFSGYNDGYDIGIMDGDDGISQSHVDSAFANGVASVTPDDGIGQADVDSAFSNGAASVDITSDNQSVSDEAYTLGYSEGVASVNAEDGVSQADVDAAYASGVASVDITSDNVSVADEAYQFGYTDGAASVTPEDGVSQANLDSLQVLLDDALANEGGSCEPIYIELLQGWNIMGYTLPFAQDVAATLAAVVDNVQIVKNNAAAVYWPEYSFNGIGDFIPGQGYQIRMLNALPNYTFPDVGGQRIELTPSVPEWVHDLPILNHPNDIKSLVKVVNLFGQEVDPEIQFKGEVLLYLYSDGSTEKRLAQ